MAVSIRRIFWSSLSLLFIGLALGCGNNREAERERLRKTRAAVESVEGSSGKETVAVRPSPEPAAGMSEPHPGGREIRPSTEPFAPDGSTDSGHWKVERIDSSRPERPQSTEVWIKRDKLRVTQTTAGKVETLVVAADAAYRWIEGETRGLAASGVPLRRPHLSSLRRFRDLGLSGRETGTEELDGERCSIWEFTEGPSTRLMVWTAPGRRHPKKEVLEDGKIKLVTSILEIPADILDSVFLPPGDVQFGAWLEVRSSISLADLSADKIVIGQPSESGSPNPGR